ncbi:SoxR reducing system RseC family protein [Candidatus Solincola sp.]
MECRGLVVGREDGRVRVRVAGAECAECGACGIFSRCGGREVEFTAHDETGAQEGEEVVLDIPDRAVLLSFLAAFGIPLLSMAAAYLLVYFLFLAVGGSVHQGAAVITAAAAGGGSFWWSVRLAGKRVIHPRVISVVGKGPSLTEGRKGTD